MSDEEYLTPEEVAKKLRIHERTVRRLLSEGKLPGIRIGARKWRVSAGALREFVERGNTPASKPPKDE